MAIQRGRNMNLIGVLGLLFVVHVHIGSAAVANSSNSVAVDIDSEVALNVSDVTTPYVEPTSIPDQNPTTDADHGNSTDVFGNFSSYQEYFREYNATVGEDLVVPFEVGASSVWECNMGKDDMGGPLNHFFQAGKCYEEYATFCGDWHFEATADQFLMTVTNVSMSDAGLYTFELPGRLKIKFRIDVWEDATAEDDPSPEATPDDGAENDPTTGGSPDDDDDATVAPEQGADSFDFPPYAVLDGAPVSLCSDARLVSVPDLRLAAFQELPELFKISLAHENVTGELPKFVNVTCGPPDEVVASAQFPLYYKPRMGRIEVVHDAADTDDVDAAAAAACGSARISCEFDAHPQAKISFGYRYRHRVGRWRFSTMEDLKMNVSCVVRERNRVEFYHSLETEEANMRVACKAANDYGRLVVEHGCEDHPEELNAQNSSNGVNTIVIVVVVILLLTVTVVVQRFLIRAKQRRDQRSRPFEGHFSLAEARAEKGEAPKLTHPTEDDCASKL